MNAKSCAQSILVFSLFLSGCANRHVISHQTPSVSVRDATPLNFRGANSPSPDKPGDADCNSPAHWDGDTFYIFSSAGHPWRASGAGIEDLSGDYRSCKYDNEVAGGRWIECTWKAEDGTLYGWYHFEPSGICPGQHPEGPNMHLTAPKIGAAKSSDNGATWTDLGVILEAAPPLKCDTTNFYFAGGNGDFSAMLDKEGEYVYFFISTYNMDVAAQGVAVARMKWTDRESPVGKVWKWHNEAWAQPGIQRLATPFLPARTDWHSANADAFWGPSIHWNSYLRQYVILLNRAKDSRWSQEGIYISFNKDLSNPLGWSAPRKIMDPPGQDRWYPQVIGTNKSKRETDKLAGKVARLFVRGHSRWELVFE